jgi:hypothetical protein
MRPENTRVWRKTGRTATKGIPAGRRTTHQVKTQKPARPSYVEKALRRRAELPLWTSDTPDGA